MDEKVRELIDATGAWVAICMKQYPDSRFVDDKLVRVCAALSAFEDSDETLLPCPFCGETPTIIIQKGTWGKIVCLNPLCLVKPEIYDDRRIADFEDIKDWKDVIIPMWNKRAKC